MRWFRVWFVLVAAVPILACAARRPVPARAARHAPPEPTRFGPECNPVIERALMTADSANTYPYPCPSSSSCRRIPFPATCAALRCG
jgi:hypothetical protein